MIVFDNVVYVYVFKTKIGEDVWRLLVVVFMVRSIQPDRLASALCL